MVLVKLKQFGKCSVRNGRWDSPDPGMDEVLQHYERENWQRSTYPANIPNRDRASAEMMVKRLGGKVVQDSYKAPKPDKDAENRVY